VVGAVLVAAYATGFTLLMRNDIDVAQDTGAAPTAQTSPGLMPSPALASASTELPGSVDGEPAALVETPASVVPAPAVAAAAAPDVPVPTPKPATPKPAVPAPPPKAVEARPQQREEISSEEIASEPAIARVEPEPTPDPASEVAAAAPMATAPAGDDSQITADVKAEIAAITAPGTIEVTTTNGVVELTGSVPTQEDVEKVRMAAGNVPAVRDVDVSALMVSN
jgi:hypothetical protein